MLAGVGLRLFAFSCGWLESDLALFVEGATGAIRVPVPSYLVDHPRGALVFDTGLHPATQADPEARLGRRIARAFRVCFSPGEELAARLAGLGVDAAAVRWLVSSHLHFDHVGGNAQLPNARLVVQKREWEAGQDADLRAANAYDPRDYDLGHDLLAVDGEHDVFGDGSVVCTPTHGHTPGHQSLRVRLPGGEVVLAADACYLRRTLESLELPPIVHDPAAMRASLLRLRALRERGARIFFGHDPEFWASLPQAPVAIS
jgi:glyoxylase-like metal-dependent hydrolase (beta-lactamase superfamily II)